METQDAHEHHHASLLKSSKDAHEHILVVGHGKVCHRLDILDMGMLTKST